MGIRSDIWTIVYNFKVDKKFWTKRHLTGPEHTNERSKPAPYLHAIYRIAQKLELKRVVDIGSLRYAVSPKCLEYFNSDPINPIVAPPCCNDGHSSFFWAYLGFETHTVDIEEHCLVAIRQSYENIKQPRPDNLITHIPEDGIKFLERFDKPIDILFLDGWDVGTGGYREKHVEAYLAAEDRLSQPHHLVAIDDTDFDIPNEGKDGLLSPLLISKGYTPLITGRQTIFINTI
jgi:hypothetical protein